jgi:hypothetical protein
MYNNIIYSKLLKYFLKCIDEITFILYNNQRTIVRTKTGGDE